MELPSILVVNNMLITGFDAPVEQARINPLLARLDVGHDVGDPRGLVTLHEEALHRTDRERAVDVAAAACALAGGRADVRAHRRDRVRFAAQDVALLEPPLSGEVQVPPAVGPDRAGLLALDVALEPGCVDRLDEEFLGGVDDQAEFVAFPLCEARGAGETGQRGRPASNLPPAFERLQRRSARGARYLAHSQVDAGHTRSYIPRRGVACPAEIGPLGGSLGLTGQEVAFLLLGMLVGSGIGATIAIVVRRRTEPKREVRVTVAPNAIPRRRAATRE